MSEKTIRYTLLSDGSSDIVLLPILTWLLEEYLANYIVKPTWAELRDIRKPLKELSDKILASLILYPCELLFIHRDAETQSRDERIREIRQALGKVVHDGYRTPVVCVIPVRMQEAWLLINEVAIRQASGNPNGKEKLLMPPIKSLENLADPKDLLYQLLRDASGFRGRRLKKFRPDIQAQRVVNFIDDFSVLRRLSAFIAFEAELQQVVEENGWNNTA